MATLAELRQRQREETRRKVYLAALDVFRREGPDQARIEDITRLANVSRPTFYFHFPTRDDVLMERLRETQLEVVQSLLELSPQARLPEVLDRTARALAEVWKDDRTLLPHVATVALRSLAASVGDRDAEPVRAALTPWFKAAAERGDLHASLPPEVLADFYLSNALAAMLAACANPELGMDVVLTGVTELFLRGVLPRTP